MQQHLPVTLFRVASRYIQESRQKLTGKEFLNLVCAVNDKLDHSKGGMSAIVNFALSCEEEIFSALMLEED